MQDKKGDKRPLQILRRFASLVKAKVVHILPFYPWDTDRGFSVMNYGAVDSSSGTWNDIEKLNETSELMFDFVMNHCSVENRLVQDSLIERHLDKNDPLYKRDYGEHKEFVIAFTNERAEELEKSGAFSKLARPRPDSVLTDYFVAKVTINVGGVNYEVVKAFMGKPQKSYTGFINDYGMPEVFLGKVPADKLAGTVHMGIVGNINIIGEGKVWTTFSRGEQDGLNETRQVDLNFGNPKVFVEALVIALTYMEKGASYIRLDAVGYLWKELGATCLHEEKTHQILQAMQTILKIGAPGVRTIAEVNEPQEKSFEYVGDEENPEADMAYQFSHFPLAVHAVLTGNTKYYRDWLETIKGYGGKQFLLIYGSHDGMGLKPVMGLLPEDERAKMEDILINEFGAKPNKGKLPSGEEIIYEICATPWNLINNPDSNDPQKIQVKRYLSVAMLGLAHRALPGIYINGMLGAKNNPDALDENRTINRQVFDEADLFRNLSVPDEHMGQVMHTIIDLLNKRSHRKAFDVDGPPVRTVDTSDEAVIAEVLESSDGEETLLQVVNMSDRSIVVTIDLEEEEALHTVLCDYLDSPGKMYKVIDEKLTVEIAPYQGMWLLPKRAIQQNFEDLLEEEEAPEEATPEERAEAEGAIIDNAKTVIPHLANALIEISQKKRKPMLAIDTTLGEGEINRLLGMIIEFLSEVDDNNTEIRYFLKDLVRISGDTGELVQRVRNLTDPEKGSVNPEDVIVITKSDSMRLFNESSTVVGINDEGFPATSYLPLLEIVLFSIGKHLGWDQQTLSEYYEMIPNVIPIEDLGKLDRQILFDSTQAFIIKLIPDAVAFDENEIKRIMERVKIILESA